MKKQVNCCCSCCSCSCSCTVLVHANKSSMNMLIVLDKNMVSADKVQRRRCHRLSHITYGYHSRIVRKCDKVGNTKQEYQASPCLDVSISLVHVQSRRSIVTTYHAPRMTTYPCYHPRTSRLALRILVRWFRWPKCCWGFAFLVILRLVLQLDFTNIRDKSRFESSATLSTCSGADGSFVRGIMPHVIRVHAM